MPTYEYKCEACGNEFERFQSITAAPIRKCPKCGKLRVKRLIGSGSGLIFKGSGFYITDYRDNGSPKKEAEKPAETKSETAKAETGGKESSGKPADGGKPPQKPAGKPAAAAATKDKNGGSGK